MASLAYQRRIARGLAQGLSRQEARGHAASPERPIRALSNPHRYEGWMRRHYNMAFQLARTRAGRQRLARLNAARAEQGLGPVIIGEPPAPGYQVRQRTMPSLAAADDVIRPIGQPAYTRVYFGREGVVFEIDPGRAARRRAA
jgi:hypothetical protein